MSGPKSRESESPFFRAARDCSGSPFVSSVDLPTPPPLSKVSSREKSSSRHSLVRNTSDVEIETLSRQIATLASLESSASCVPEGKSESNVVDHSEHTGFVEFHLGDNKQEVPGSHNRARMVKEESRELPANPDEPPEAPPIFDDDNWRPMDSEVMDDFYDQKGNYLDQTNAYDPLTHSHQNNASHGYTRVAAEEQAEVYRKIDKTFDFLLMSESSNIKRLQEDSERESDSEENSSSQLYSTKNMLSEGQKIAYVGLVYLVMIEMATTLANVRGSHSSSLAKKLSKAHGSLQKWSIKIISRIFDHLDLSPEERRMIEKLSSHGLVPEDLTKSLKGSEVLRKPEVEDDSLIIVEGERTSSDAQKIEIDIRWTVVCDLFLNLLADSMYDSRSRTLLMLFARYVGLEPLEVCEFERRITDALEMEEASDQTWDGKEIISHRKKMSRTKKMAYVGIATIGGGLVIGLSAGLLAPVITAGIAAGFSTVGIAGTSSFLAGVGGTALVTSTGVAAGARIGSSGMMKRVGDLKTFEFRPLHNNGRVNLIITVSGWMSSKDDDVRIPFSTVDPVMGDLFSLLWEPEMLTSMGQTVNILATEVLAQSVQQILGQTVLMALMSSLQLPMALSKLGYLVDNPWNVTLDRAWKAGLVLADTLIKRNLGVRPVTLVGFSVGARVIYSCLLELARQGAFGLVEDVYLFGAPFVHKRDQLASARSVVSGRFVNGYTRKDWILGYLFRATSGGLRSVAGLTSIGSISEVEDFDCSEYVDGHMAYRKAMPKLLRLLGWQVLEDEVMEIDEPDVEQTERQRQLLDELEQAKHRVGKEKRKSGWKSWFKADKKEWMNLAENASEPQKETSSENHDTVFDVNAIRSEVLKMYKEGDFLEEGLENKTEIAKQPPTLNEELEEGDSLNVQDVFTPKPQHGTRPFRLEKGKQKTSPNCCTPRSSLTFKVIDPKNDGNMH